MRARIWQLLACEAGASAAEYALILAVVGTAIAVAALTLGTSISSRLTSTGTCISTSGATC